MQSSDLKKFFMSMDVSIRESRSFFPQPYLQGEPFANENQFFRSLFVSYTKLLPSLTLNQCLFLF